MRIIDRARQETKVGVLSGIAATENFHAGPNGSLTAEVSLKVEGAEEWTLLWTGNLVSMRRMFSKALDCIRRDVDVEDYMLNYDHMGMWITFGR